MEIYCRKGIWLGAVFGAVAVSLLMAQLGVIDTTNVPSKRVGYIIISIISFFALLAGSASTRLYFDNSERACIQDRTHFWRTKRLVYPYEDILNIEVRLSRRTSNNVGGYEVGFTQETSMFGQKARKYIQLRYFGSTSEDYRDAVKFAKDVCEYSTIAYKDDTQIIRPL